MPIFAASPSKGQVSLSKAPESLTNGKELRNLKGMSQLFKKHRNDLFAIVFLTGAVFLALSFISYNPYDPSLNSLGKGLKATNYCGVVGSFLADIMFQFFGLASWFFVIFSLKSAYFSFRGKSFEWKSLQVLLGGLFLVTITALLGVYFSQIKLFSNQIFIGGLLGLSISQSLMKILNPVGVQVVLWAMFTILLIFFSEKNLKELTEAPRALFMWISQWGMWKKFSFKALMAAGSASDNKKSKVVAVAPVEIVKKNDKKSEKISPQLDFEDYKAKKAAEAEEESRASAQLSQEEDAVITPFEPQKRRVVLKAKVPRTVENWEMPKLSLLEDPPVTRIKIDEKEIRRKADVLLDKLKQFDVNGQISAIKPGPAVTMFELKPNADVAVSQVTKLADDLSLALSAESLRIIAPIPGRDVIGIETSNAQRETVYLKDLLADETFWSDEMKLPIALGKQTNGEPKIVDLRKMPHLLIAGTTGSGKSVFTVATIAGFLFRHSPKTLKLIMVDPKQVDLAAFSEIPHLIMPPIRDPKKAVFALRWAVKEMEKRYRSMSKFGARNIEQFNETVEKLSSEQTAEYEKEVSEMDGDPKRKLDQYYYTSQPYIVIVVEEFGDLMAVDKQNVEQNVVRLAQMARACGIHLMLAMQSPRKEVVTGLIKTNIPGRISFKVASKMDSRIILDDQGAERLLTQGDMLFLSGGVSKPARHHGPFLKEVEINAVAKHWSDQAPPQFDPIAIRALEGTSESGGGEHSGGDFSSDGGEDYDDRYDEILSWAAEQKEVSASLIQRRFRLGYPRAARIIELFEREGVVGPANGSKPRQVLVAAYKEP